jgi:N-acetylglucosamine-6-phosphate deacetylase
VDDAGVLAGSDLDMASAVRNTAALGAVSLAEACAMASAHPAAFLGLETELGAIAPGMKACLVEADADLRVRRTWIDGVAQEVVAVAA